MYHRFFILFTFTIANQSIMNILTHCIPSVMSGLELCRAIGQDTSTWSHLIQQSANRFLFSLSSEQLAALHNMKHNGLPSLPSSTQRNKEDFIQLLESISDFHDRKQSIFICELFKEPVWRVIYNHLGPFALSRLLCESRVFVKQKSGLVQILGAPIQILKRTAQQSIDAPPPKRSRKKKSHFVKSGVCSAVIGQNTNAANQRRKTKRNRPKRHRRKPEKLCEQLCSKWTSSLELLLKDDRCSKRNPKQNSPAQLSARQLMYSNCAAGKWPSDSPFCATGKGKDKMTCFEYVQSVTACPEPLFELANQHLALRTLVQSLHDFRANLGSIQLNRDVPCPSQTKLISLSVSDLIKQYAKPPTYAVNILQSILNRSIPDSLIGQSNKSQLIKSIANWLRHVRKHDQCKLNFFLNELNANNMPFMRQMAGGDRLKRLLFSRLVHLLIRLAAGIVRSLFYVTDVQGQRTALVFYPRTVWTRIQHIATIHYTRKCRLQRVTLTQTRSMAIYSSKLTACPIRYLPKTSGQVRMLVLSVIRNRQLLYVKHALQYVLGQHPIVFGVAVSTIKQAKRRWTEFVRENRDQPMCLVRTDIRACYDSINHKLLKDIVVACFGRLNADERLVFSKWIYHSRIGHKTLRRTIIRAHTTRKPASVQCGGAGLLVSVPNGLAQHCMSVAQLQATVLRVIDSHVLRLRGRYYRQTHGIPQGNNLSSLLCAIYCGALEHRCLRQWVTVSPKRLFMRYMDDYLLAVVGPDRRQIAHGLLNLLNDKQPGHDLAEFQLEFSKSMIVESDSFPTGSPLLKWCGLSLCSDGLSTTVTHLHSQSVIGHCADSVIVRLLQPIRTLRHFIMLNMRKRDKALRKLHLSDKERVGLVWLSTVHMLHAAAQRMSLQHMHLQHTLCTPVRLHMLTLNADKRRLVSTGAGNGLQ